ncbi:hypothetical protein DFH08DRAFT_968681 [Mycena albidolilacea]|uniref:Uncharacterized protein n=1 Tax=Mycena albidolilacea TaxID=1033008 RepID=A0AAD6ZIW6_9AGAR|nr:hypothetical protein DFH08DRAFT_968681 [Mycena albidolilacea]
MSSSPSAQSVSAPVETLPSFGPVHTSLVSAAAPPSLSPGPHTDDEPIYSVTTLEALPRNDIVESTLQQLAQIHNISYQAPRAVIFASLQGNNNHPVDWVQPIEDPMRPTAHHLIRQLAVSKPDFRQAVALSSTSGGLLRVVFSRTPFSLRDRASLHSDHGYRSLGMYEDIAAGSPEVDVPSAKECDTLAQFLLAEQLGPSTPCYVLYFIGETAVHSTSALPPPVRLDRTTQNSGPSSVMATSHRGPIVNNVSPAVSSFLLERFPQIYSMHRQLLATMFGATYKNFHLTRYVYQICDALDMRALRGAPPPYRHGDLVVTQEEVVDSLGGAISGASFRNWRNYWVLAQEVMAPLA